MNGTRRPAALRRPHPGKDRLDQHNRGQRALTEALARAREEAVVAERERLAGDLHDTVGQALVAIRLLALAHEERLTKDAPLAPVLARIAEMATAGKGDLTEVARSLAFAPVGRRGLVPALRDLVRSISTDSGIEMTLVAEGRPQHVPEDVALALYRVAQEALTNAWRHADCRRVEVRLVYEQGEVSLVVADDGVGIDPGRPVTGIHLGLGGMRRAMTEVGGVAELRPGRDHGTVVEARAALAPRQ